MLVEHTGIDRFVIDFAFRFVAIGPFLAEI